MTALDPRRSVIPRRLEPVRRVVAVTGGKGGIGKSTVACALALSLARRGRRTGLLDLDLTGPCDHVILGLDTGFPEEPHGIEPSRQHGLHFMSLAHFARDAAAPLRGEDQTSATLELLAITRWPELDELVIDMPPGLADSALDVVSLVEGAGFLVVATPSRIVLETVERKAALLKRLGVPVLGLLGNLGEDGERGEGDPAVRALAARHGLDFLGSVPRDEAFEAALGDPEALAATEAVRAVDRLVAARIADGSS